MLNSIFEHLTTQTPFSIGVKCPGVIPLAFKYNCGLQDYCTFQ